MSPGGAAGDRVVETAHAKVNLFLEIRGRRSDGFHEIDTLMHEIDLADEVILEHASNGESRLDIDVPELDLGEDNLGLRALRALERRVGRSLPTQISIRKRIPAGGGLGGGSSDATAVLRGANALHELHLPAEDLEEVAAEVGSDTAFFVRGGTAICRGRGEIVRPIADPNPLHFLLLLPFFSISTGPVFGELRLSERARGSYALLRRLGWNAPPIGNDAALFNRLEEPARRLHPDLDDLLSTLRPAGFRLSGSGSTCFAIVSDAEEAAREAQFWSERVNGRVLTARSAR